MDAVLRLLHGEPMEQLARELEVEAQRLAAWGDDFLEHASAVSWPMAASSHTEYGY
jgi:hypothetical protein